MAVAKMKSLSVNEPVIGLTDTSRKQVSEYLAQTLSDTYLLQVKTKFYHWNVTGHQFASLHALFDAQYTELSGAVDEIAERIRALGHTSPGTLRDFLQLSSLTEDKTLPEDWTIMVKNLVSGHEEIIRECRGKLALTQKADDEGTADLYIRRLLAHEKAAWMLRSHLQ